LVEQAKLVCKQSRHTREMAVAAGARAKALMRRISENAAADVTVELGVPVDEALSRT
jgi:hypothetical protein